MADEKPSKPGPTLAAWMCGARLKKKADRPGVHYCRRAKAKGRNNCPLHGGRNPIGADVPWFKNGARSRYMPDGWIENFDKYLETKDVTLEREVALASILLDEALLAVKEESPITVTRELRKKIVELKTALTMKDTDPKDVIRLVEELDKLSSSGVAAAQTRKELREAIDFRSKIAKREADRQIAMGAVLTPIQAAIIFRAFEEAVKRYVPDRIAIAKIAQHLAPAINRGALRQSPIDCAGLDAGSGPGGGDDAGVPAPEPA